MAAAGTDAGAPASAAMPCLFRLAPLPLSAEQLLQRQKEQQDAAAKRVVTASTSVRWADMAALTDTYGSRVQAAEGAGWLPTEWLTVREELLQYE